MDPGGVNLFVVIFGAIFALIVVMVITYKAFYRKSPPDSALVISGGKKKRVVFGGSLVNPITNTTQLVSLNTMQLAVERTGQDALITKDSLRVDIEAQFYVKVESNEKDVLEAVASLGDKTLTPDDVKKLLEGKLVGVLRSVAATMELQELHEKRQEFSDQVREACKDDLEQNGFKLESVAVTNLDQTPLTQLDENNRFDVIAIQTIKQEVEERQTQTAKIEQENKVAREKDRLTAEISIKKDEEETETQSLEVEKRLALAQEMQRKEIATDKAEQERAVKEHELEQQQAIEEARIRQEEAVRSAEIEQKQRIDTARIEQERQVREAEIAQTEAIETARIAQEQKVQSAEITQKQAVERARIVQEQEVQAAEIERNLTIEQAKIAQQRTVEEARIQQEQAIEEATIMKSIALVARTQEEKEAQAASEIQIAMKEKEREIAETDRLASTAEKARAEVQVLTVEAIEEAERDSKIALIKAEQEADEARIAKERIADAEAYTVIEAAKAEQESSRLKAEAQKTLAEALLVEATAKAEGEEKLIEAKNAVEQKILTNEALLALIESLPEVTGQLMKPAEQIESIRILDLGANGHGNGNGAAGGGMNRILGSILGAGAALPMLKEIMNFSGVDSQNVIKTVKDYVSGVSSTSESEAVEPTEEVIDSE